MREKSRFFQNTSGSFIGGVKTLEFASEGKCYGHTFSGTVKEIREPWLLASAERFVWLGMWLEVPSPRF